MRKKELAKLDRKLDHWAATDKQHKAEVIRLEALHKNQGWTDAQLAAYQKMTAKFQ